MNFKQFINEDVEVYYKPFVDTWKTGERLAVFIKKGKSYQYKINQDQFQRIEAYRQPNGLYSNDVFNLLRDLFAKPKPKETQLKFKFK